LDSLKGKRELKDKRKKLQEENVQKKKDKLETKEKTEKNEAARDLKKEEIDDPTN